MSDTPRTEAEVNRQKCWSDDLVSIDANFACQLERELNAANESFRKLNIHTLNLVDRIRRLEEALDAYRKAYTPDGHVSPHDCFATGPKTGNPYQDLIACPGCWAERKAKEAKL